MSAPHTEIVQMTYRNPHATMDLIVPVAVICNTPDDDLRRNIRANSALPLPWAAAKPAHDGIAVLCGGGPSLAEHLDDIRALAAEGACIIAMNAASRFLRKAGISVDWQVIADAKPETAQLVDPGAGGHLFASQVSKATLDCVERPTLWHLEIGDIENDFPKARRDRGGYALIGGGAAVGNSALCLFYALGYRQMHVFGFDSCHKDGASHAYDQPMNRFIPGVNVEWAGKTYFASLAMKAQAEKFQITAQALKQAGCALHVHGDGLLQAMYRTPAKDLAERDKYRLLWQFDGYRDIAPGEELVDLFLEVAKPSGMIADFGCGTGRASLALHKRDHNVFLIDFADNCRDEEALCLPFLEWDLTRSIPIRAPFGFCTDVMEHIPPQDVDGVLRNILASAEKVFFQISTVDDICGDIIGATLHHTVKPHDWWRETILAHGISLIWEQDRGNASLFYVTRQ